MEVVKRHPRAHRSTRRRLVTWVSWTPGARRPVRQRRSWPGCSSTGSQDSWQIFLVLFMTDRGYSSSQAGLALGLYGAGAVVGTFVGGWLSDRLSARSATVISMVGSAR